MFLYYAIVALAFCVHATFVDDYTNAVVLGGAAVMCVVVDVVWSMMRWD
jgi:hypothetical protein